MKVLLGVWAVKIGGAETFAVNFCNFLNKNGCEAFLFPINGSHDYEYFKWIQKSGVKILTPFKLGIIDWFCWKLNAFTEKVFKKSIRESLNKLYFKYITNRYHFNCFVSNSVSVDEFVSKYVNLSIPYIIIEHGDYCKKILDGHPFLKKPFQLATSVVCVSQWCKNILDKEIKPSKIEVIYNGHIQNKIEPLQDLSQEFKDKFVFGMLGRDDPHKGWREAIKAFLVVNKSHPETRLLLIGDGPHLSNLRKEYCKNSSIVFAGRQADPQNWIQYIDVGLILSSQYEAFGIVILDFFSQSKPVVASKLGGIPEVVQVNDKKGGIVVPLNEFGKANEDGVVNAMVQLMKDGEYRKLISSQASEIYKNFSFERTGTEYLHLIKELVKEK